jgi:hypothetical protein
MFGGSCLTCKIAKSIKMSEVHGGDSPLLQHLKFSSFLIELLLGKNKMTRGIQYSDENSVKNDSWHLKDAVTDNNMTFTHPIDNVMPLIDQNLGST